MEKEPAPEVAAPEPSKPEVTRLATATAPAPAASLIHPTQPRPVPTPTLESPRASQPEPAAVAEPSPIVLAKRAIADCRVRFQQVQDYTCTFLKRERIDGRLSSYNIMAMKVRTRPHSIYVKFQKPTAGREAIYVTGRHGGRVLAHDVGLGKVIAGTLLLDPRGSRAMEDCRHPITEAGIGHMIETVYERWQAEMKEGETQVTIANGTRVGNRVCTMIESMHPQHHSSYLFYKVKVYIDQELGLPIRFEAYDWPRRPGQAGELLEEYTYMNLRLNAGLHERDFDPNNSQYSFGRF